MKVIFRSLAMWFAIPGACAWTSIFLDALNAVHVNADKSLFALSLLAPSMFLAMMASSAKEESLLLDWLKELYND